MKAIEFETDAKGNIIEIPEKYSHLYSKHLRIIALIAEEDPGLFHGIEDKKDIYDFSDLSGKLEWQGDAVAEQRKLRNEW